MKTKTKLNLIAFFGTLSIGGILIYIEDRKIQRRKKQNMKAPVFGVTHTVKDH